MSDCILIRACRRRISPGDHRLIYFKRRSERNIHVTVMRRVAALLAICAVLVITTVSVLPGHDHEGQEAGTCGLCYSGHLPCLQSSCIIQLHVRTRIVWQHASDDSEPQLQVANVSRSPRAPPV